MFSLRCCDSLHSQSPATSTVLSYPPSILTWTTHIYDDFCFSLPTCCFVSVFPWIYDLLPAVQACLVSLFLFLITNDMRVPTRVAI